MGAGGRCRWPRRRKGTITQAESRPCPRLCRGRSATAWTPETVFCWAAAGLARAPCSAAGALSRRTRFWEAGVAQVKLHSNRCLKPRNAPPISPFPFNSSSALFLAFRELKICITVLGLRWGALILCSGTRVAWFLNQCEADSCVVFGCIGFA